MKNESKVAGFLCVLFLFSTHVQAVEIDCEYDSNAEWPQTAQRICQKQLTLPILADDSSSRMTMYPTCSSQLSDSDGDGWGWENGASCKVSVKSGHPVCKNADSDNDGDGWGWENGASCRIDSVPKPDYAICEYRISDADGDGWGFENGRTCQISAGSLYPVCSNAIKDTDGDGWGYEFNASCRFVTPKKRNGVVFEQNFESTALGSYGSDRVNADWNTPFWHLGFVQGRVDIVSDKQRGKSMRVTYPADKYGAAGAAAFLSDVAFGLDLPTSYEELYVSYDVKFAAGFDFVRGGKLPGLCGYDNTRLPVSGCNTGGGFPNGFDGWSARGMWRENGELENYVYHAGQKNYYGDDQYWGEDAQPGKWHRVQHRVVLNTPGVANGILEAWLDGKKVLSEDRFLFRKSSNIGINLFYFSTFYGGNDPSWAPSEDQYIYFDNFRIGTDSEVSIGQALPLNDEEVEVESASGDNSGGGATSRVMILFLLLVKLMAPATGVVRRRLS